MPWYINNTQKKNMEHKNYVRKFCWIVLITTIVDFGKRTPDSDGTCDHSWITMLLENTPSLFPSIFDWEEGAVTVFWTHRLNVTLCVKHESSSPAWAVSVVLIKRGWRALRGSKWHPYYPCDNGLWDCFLKSIHSTKFNHSFICFRHRCQPLLMKFQTSLMSDCHALP